MNLIEEEQALPRGNVAPEGQRELGHDVPWIVRDEVLSQPRVALEVDFDQIA